MGSISEGNDGVACMAKVNGVSAVGCIKKIKLLKHRIFTSGGSLEGIDLGAGREESDLTRAGNLVEKERDSVGIAISPSGESGVHPKTKVAVFKLGFEAGPHGGEGKVGYGAGRIGDVGTEGAFGFVQNALAFSLWPT